MMRKHNQIQALLHRALDVDLSADEQRALDTHLATCADCRAYAARLSQLDSTLYEQVPEAWRKRAPQALYPTVKHTVRSASPKRYLQSSLALAAGFMGLLLISFALMFTQSNEQPFQAVGIPPETASVITMTATATATSTPAPTITPLPTATQTPRPTSTPTPEPTHTPQPTSTPEPIPTSNAYRFGVHIAPNESSDSPREITGRLLFDVEIMAVPADWDDVQLNEPFIFMADDDLPQFERLTQLNLIPGQSSRALVYAFNSTDAPASFTYFHNPTSFSAAGLRLAPDCAPISTEDTTLNPCPVYSIPAGATWTMVVELTPAQDMLRPAQADATFCLSFQLVEP